jgi:pyrrolidone-carboxylate peptidase
MGKKIRIHLSYFKFNPLDTNHTCEIVVENLKRSLSNNNNPYFEFGSVLALDFMIFSCKYELQQFINTAIQDNLFKNQNFKKERQSTLSDINSKIEFSNQKKSCLSKKDLSHFENPFTHNILIHIGFAPSKDKIEMHYKAINNADFDVEDLDGHQPWQEKIDDDFSIFHQLKSNINFHSILSAVDPNKLSLIISKNCGTCLNNYLYFQMLLKFEEYNMDAGLLNIVDFEEIPKEIQESMIKNILIEIAKQRVQQSFKKYSEPFKNVS